MENIYTLLGTAQDDIEAMEAAKRCERLLQEMDQDNHQRITKITNAGQNLIKVEQGFANLKRSLTSILTNLEQGLHVAEQGFDEVEESEQECRLRYKSLTDDMTKYIYATQRIHLRALAVYVRNKALSEMREGDQLDSFLRSQISQGAYDYYTHLISDRNDAAYRIDKKEIRSTVSKLPRELFEYVHDMYYYAYREHIEHIGPDKEVEAGDENVVENKKC